jgi:hypothetical protein
MVTKDGKGDCPAPSRRVAVRSSTRSPRRLAPLIAWFTCLSAALALLLWLGDGRLAAPDLTSPATWKDWVTARTAAESAVSLLRMLALGVAWYLVGATTVSVLAHALRAGRLVRVADALSVGPIKTVVQQALGVSLAAGVLLTTVPGITGSSVGAAPVAKAVASTVTATQLGSVTASPIVTWLGASADVERLVPVPAPTGAVADAGGARVGPDSEMEPPVAAAGGPGRTVRVLAGDHLWGLAEADVEGHLGGEATEAQVLAHWTRVVEANRDRLIVPANPDLLHPGQIIVLPRVEADA